MTDSVHLVKAFQASRGRGSYPRDAALESLRRVGPACALTSATTVVGFCSLTTADVASVRAFGVSCALGMALSFVAVVTVVPLLLGSAIGERVPAVKPAVPGSAARRPLGMRRARLVSVLGLLLAAVSLAAVPLLESDYRYREYLPADSEALRVIERVEAGFGGSFPYHVVVEWIPGVEDEEVLAVLHRVAEALGRADRASRPVSVLEPIHALAGRDHDLEGELAALESLPDDVVRGRFRPEIRRALVTVRLPGETARAQLRTFAEFESRLETIEEEADGITVRPTGLLRWSTRASLEMIGSLAGSLLVAVPLIFLILAIGLRSVRLTLVSIVPNLLPPLSVLVFLVVTGRPLQFTTVTLVTVLLALAVDDSIHVLADLRRRLARGVGLERALERTLQTVRPALWTTTALLVAGFGAVGASGAPMVRLFGWLGVLGFVVALCADLVLLPALVLATTPAGHRWRSARSAPSSGS